MPQDEIIDAINDLATRVDGGYLPLKEEEAFIMDAEEVLAIALNQIEYIKTRIKSASDNL